MFEIENNLNLSQQKTAPESTIHNSIKRADWMFVHNVDNLEEKQVCSSILLSLTLLLTMTKYYLLLIGLH